MRRVRKALAAPLGSLKRILSLAQYVERGEKRMKKETRVS